jgi:hypothetical protein
VRQRNGHARGPQIAAAAVYVCRLRRAALFAESGPKPTARSRRPRGRMAAIVSLDPWELLRGCLTGAIVGGPTPEYWWMFGVRPPSFASIVLGYLGPSGR